MTHAVKQFCKLGQIALAIEIGTGLKLGFTHEAQFQIKRVEAPGEPGWSRQLRALRHRERSARVQQLGLGTPGHL